MSASHPGRAELSEADRQTLQSLCTQFEQAWAEGFLAAYFGRLPATGPLRAVGLLELVKIDLRRHWERGVQRTVEVYLKAYPELGTPETFPVELLDAEHTARDRCKAQVSWSAYKLCFPRQTEELQRHLDKTQSGAAPPSGAATQLPPEIGEMLQQIGRYKLLRKLGKGGMGAVYLAEDTQLDRQVALKVPHFTPQDGPDVLARFYREARAAATLQHANICPVYDVGESNGTHYLTMAFIEGQTLAQRLEAKKQPLSQREIAVLVRQVALALAEAHRRGIIHRDLKPANILINGFGEPVVMDFGLARRVDQESMRLTKTGELLGTPAYMPPEQVNGDVQAMGPCCDIYSLGVILYELLTGRRPFEGTMVGILSQILVDPPKPPRSLRPDVDPQLEAICLKAMAKKPADRFASMPEFTAALAAYLEGDATVRAASGNLDTLRVPTVPAAAAPPLAPPTPQGGGSGRRFGGVLGGLAVALLAALPVAFVGYAIVRTPPESTTSGPTPTPPVAQEGTIQLALEPPNAKVELQLDDKRLPLTELAQPLHLAPGKHDLVVTGSDYKTKHVAFEVDPGPNAALPVKLERAEGSLKITLVGTPSPGSVVKVDGAAVTRGQLDKGLRLPVGQHQLEVASPGHKRVAQSFGVRRDEQTNLRVELELLSGTLTVRLDKPGATAEVQREGKTVAVKPGEPFGLPAGEYQLVVSGRDYETVKKKITVRPGENTQERVALDWRTGQLGSHWDLGLQKEGNHVHAVHFTADGRVLAATFNRTIRVLNADTHIERKPIELKLNPEFNVTAAAFSADGSRVLVALAKLKGLEPRVRLWDLTAPKELGTWDKLTTHQINHVAISPDGRRALVGDNGGTVHLLDLKDGTVEGKFDLPTEKKGPPRTHAVAFLPGGPMVFASGEEPFVRLWNTNTKKFGRQFAGEAGERFNSLAAAPGGRIALGSNGNKPLRLWEPNPKKGVETDLPAYGSPILCLAFSPDGHRLLSGGADNSVRLWDLTTLAAKWSSEPLKGRVQHVAFAPDGRRAISSSGTVVRLWGLPK